MFIGLFVSRYAAVFRRCFLARIARMTRIVQCAVGFGLPNRHCHTSRHRREHCSFDFHAFAEIY